MSGDIQILNHNFNRKALKGITSQKAFAKAFPSVNAAYVWPLVKAELNGKEDVQEEAEQDESTKGEE